MKTYRERLDDQWMALTAKAKIDWTGLERFIRDVLQDTSLEPPRALAYISEALGAWTGRGEAKHD